MIAAHKIELRPTKEQEVYLRKACGVSRFAHNWALEEWNRQRAAGQKPTAFKLDKQLNAIKREKFPWMYDVTKCAAQGAVQDLGTAFSSFFKKKSRYPVFRKKGARDSFYTTGECVQLLPGRRVKIHRLARPIRMTQSLRFTGKVLCATYSCTANKWFVSITVEVPGLPPSENQARVGIDLGISSAVVTSDGEVFVSPRPLKNKMKRLKRLQRQVSRKVRGSQNRDRAVQKLALAHYRVACARKDFTHKMTTKLVKTYGTICMEDLSARSMVKNHRLAQALSDIGFGEIRRQVEYKAARLSQRVLFVDRFYPSTKTCHRCGHVLEKMTLSQRTFSCPVCGLLVDRDLNAAKNILMKCTEGSSGNNACGDLTLVGSLKQESLAVAGTQHKKAL